MKAINEITRMDPALFGAISCDFVDRSCPSEKKHETKSGRNSADDLGSSRFLAEGFIRGIMRAWPSGSYISSSGIQPKLRDNLRKHRVAFERAATIFLDPEALSELDEDESGVEDRWITLGLDRTGGLLLVCHTYREETKTSARIRLISARKPTKNEAKHYERK